MNKILFSILITLLLTFCQQAYTQPPPPSDHGLQNDQQAPAPIGGGLTILVGLGLAYGAGKAYAGRGAFGNLNRK